jgi:hypothetical protein
VLSSASLAIERQTAHADFAVEPAMAILLRFKYSAMTCMSSGKLVLQHPKTVRDKQREHIFFDTLSIVASALVVTEGERQRVMRFDEFNAFIDCEDNLKQIHPIPILFEEFTTYSRPILWLRMVALAQLCVNYIAVEGPPLGFGAEPIDLAAMLSVAEDEFITKHFRRYRGIIDHIATLG